MRQLKIKQQITNRESKSLDRYLQEISKVDMITAEDEVELARRIRDGDTLALEKLTKANLRFVISVAKQYQNQGLPLGDLINEGNLGLMRAATRFDETRGFKFISYAVWWIRQSIIQAISEQSRIVRLPLNRTAAIRKVNKSFSKLEQEFQREPTAEEIAGLIEEMKEDQVKDTFKISGRHISMDAPLVAGEDNSLLDVLGNEGPEPDHSLIDESLSKEIDRALKTLSGREGEIIKLYFGLQGEAAMTLDEIGEMIGLTRERVRQIKEKALRRLRHTTRSKLLKGFLG